MENHHQQEHHHHHHQFLPYEILTGILSRLPADSTLQFKRVCKAWRSIIEDDPVFHDMCLRRLVSSSVDNNYSASTSSLGFVTLENIFCTHYVCYAEYKHDDDDQKVMSFKKWRLPLPFKDNCSPNITYRRFTIVGSCNGLICISVIPYHLTLVCNPLTGEVVNLSNSSINSSLILVGFGFGYLPSTNEYKIVRIYASSAEDDADDDTRFKNEERSIGHVQVYTLGSGRWRYILPQISSSSSSSSWSDITLIMDPKRSSSWWSDITLSFGVSVNGTLYFNNCRNRRKIVSFDLAKEEFRIIVSPPPPPPTPFTKDIGIGGFGVLEGRLCAAYSRYLSNSTSTAGTIITDLWVLMEEKADDKEMDQDFPNWIKKFSLPPQREVDRMYHFHGYRPLGTISPPRILLQSNSSRMNGIVSYNPETDNLCCRDIDGDKSMVIPYVKSFVSLKALGETLQGKNLRC